MEAVYGFYPGKCVIAVFLLPWRVPMSRAAFATSRLGPVALGILRTLFADLLRLLMMGNFSEFGMDLSTSRLSCMQLRATPHLVTTRSFSLSGPTMHVRSSNELPRFHQRANVIEHYARKSCPNEQPANSRAFAYLLCPPFARARRMRSLR